MDRIAICPRDIYEKEKILAKESQSSTKQPQSYRDLVVLKPWGYEYLIYENEDVAIWFLHIKKGHSTSMHCHPKKKTSLALLRGRALCNTFERRCFVGPFNGVTIDEGVFHSTLSESDGGIELIELETPIDKTDLVRFNDKYGRETKGYEKTTEMIYDNLEQYGFFDINKEQDGQGFKLERPHWKMEVHHYDGEVDFRENFKLEVSSLYQILKGNIFVDEEKAFTTGDQFVTTEIADSNVLTSGPLILLQIRP